MTATFAALLAAASFRSTTGALIEPLEAEFGWSRALTSGAITVNFVLYGLTAPFAAALMGKFGVRGVVVTALALIASGIGLSTLMTAGWQLYALWGLFVGIGTGSVALVLGAIVANRWFVKHRGLMIGVFSAASATGQLVFLPLVANVTGDLGWRQACLLILRWPCCSYRSCWSCSPSLLPLSGLGRTAIPEPARPQPRSPRPQPRSPRPR